MSRHRGGGRLSACPVPALPPRARSHEVIRFDGGRPCGTAVGGACNRGRFVPLVCSRTSSLGDERQAAVELEAVSMVYGSNGSKVAALDALSLTFARGTFTAIMGPFRVGKDDAPAVGLRPRSTDERARCGSAGSRSGT